MDALASPWPPNGGRVVVTVIVQSTLLEAQGRQKHRPHWGTELCSRMHMLRGDHWLTNVHPFCNHGNAAASPLPHLSDRWATNLLGDPSATVLNMFKTWWRPWRPWRLLNLLCTTLEWPRQPCCLLWTSNGDLVSFMVARGRHKGHRLCVKGVLPISVNHLIFW